LKERDIIHAIGRGFSPERALRLSDEECVLDILDLTEYVGDSERALTRYKGRIIGKEGRTRKIIEELTGASISVYGKTISLIGTFNQNAIAREAVEMILRGSNHSTVYKFLERKKVELKKEAIEIWKTA